MNQLQLVKLLEIQVMGMNPVRRFFIVGHMNRIKEIVTSKRVRGSVSSEINGYIWGIGLNAFLDQKKCFEFEREWLNIVRELFESLEDIV